MKRTLDEILTAVNDIVGEENTSDAVIELIEDLTDTINAVPTGSEGLQAEIDRLTRELEDVKLKYKRRFLGYDDEDTEDEEEEKTEEIEEPDGDEITLKDIFKKKEEN